MTCGKCRKRNYCSTTCQRQDWRDRHKRECVPAPPAHSIADKYKLLKEHEPVFLQLLTAFSYACMSNGKDGRVQYVTILIVNDPWGPVDQIMNTSPHVILLTSTLPTEHFVNCSQHTIRKIGRDVLLNNPHYVPLVIVREVTNSTMDNGKLVTPYVQCGDMDVQYAWRQNLPEHKTYWDEALSQAKDTSNYAPLFVDLLTHIASNTEANFAEFRQRCSDALATALKADVTNLLEGREMIILYPGHNTMKMKRSVITDTNICGLIASCRDLQRVGKGTRVEWTQDLINQSMQAQQGSSVDAPD